MKKIIIAAVAANGVIGKDGKLPWKIPEEMKFFRETTIGKMVVMGRKTFESFGSEPLNDRYNIVFSRSPTPGHVWKRMRGENFGLYWQVGEWQYAIRLSRYFHDKSYQAVNKSKREVKKGRNLFIIGGSSVYAQAIPICDEMLISRIRKEYEGDTRFPDFDESQFTKEIIKECEEFYVERYTKRIT